jgi:hypothetical protein
MAGIGEMGATFWAETIDQQPAFSSGCATVGARLERVIDALSAAMLASKPTSALDGFSIDRLTTHTANLVQLFCAVFTDNNRLTVDRPKIEPLTCFELFVAGIARFRQHIYARRSRAAHIQPPDCQIHRELKL